MPRQTSISESDSFAPSAHGHRTANPQKRTDWTILLLLAIVQFVHVLDFIIVMPLGPQLMRMLNVGPTEFAALISVYNLSAATAGLAGAFILDRYDRKSALLMSLAGLILGTLACGLSPSLASLTFARAMTGAFGGVIQALLFAIIGDHFGEKRRGAATGTVMSAFSFASVVGVPLALSAADHFDWRMPFFLLTLIGASAWVGVWRVFPSIKEHFSDRFSQKPPYDRHSFAMSIRSTWKLATEQNTVACFLLIVLLMFAGFTVIPFMSAYLVANVGLAESDLAIVFFIGGATTLLTSRLAGIFADRYGNLKVFTLLAIASTVPVVALTHLQRTSVAIAVGISTLFIVLVSARSVPAMAMITSSIERARRGAFLSLTSSVQQGASALASFLTGATLDLDVNRQIIGYALAGDIAVVSTVLACIAARRLKAYPEVRI